MKHSQPFNSTSVKHPRRKFLMGAAAMLLLAEKSLADSSGTIRGEELKHEALFEGVDVAILSGDKHGFDGLSLLLSNIKPGAGPALHMHDFEELHVVYEGTITYLVGDRKFSVSAPFVQHIPAKTPHTFINSGSFPVRNTAIFNSKVFSAKNIGPNPLIARNAR
jgi:mannose-6-phosphate isomerase-like protein (cupin superfamily)